MRKQVYWVAGVIIMLLIIGGIYYSINEKEIGGDGLEDDEESIWSGITSTVELTKDGMTREGFEFSENPVLRVFIHDVSEDGTYAFFIVRTGEEGQTSGPWVDSEPFRVNVSESYFYESENLTIRLVELDISNKCSEGAIC